MSADPSERSDFIPLEWARAFCLALPSSRPVIVDLSCGHGLLLVAATSFSTNHLLGCDVKPVPSPHPQTADLVVADLTEFYSLLRVVNWQSDLFVLNPPDLRWNRERLKDLAQSDCVAVRAAFGALDDCADTNTIDSTIATLCVALDRCSQYGEGLLVTNESILQRLILSTNAPHSALAAHVWAHCVVDAGIFENVEREAALTGLIYFSRSHEGGCKHTLQIASLASAQSESRSLFTRRSDLRLAEADPSKWADNAVELWRAAKQRAVQRLGKMFPLLSREKSKGCYTVIFGPGDVKYFKPEDFLEANIEDFIAFLKSVTKKLEIKVPNGQLSIGDFEFGGMFIGSISDDSIRLNLEEIDSLTEGEAWEERLRIHHKLGRFCFTKATPSWVYCRFHRLLQLRGIAPDECLNAWIKDTFDNEDIIHSYRKSPEHLVVGQLVFAKTAFVRKRLKALEQIESAEQTKTELELLRRSNFDCFIYLMEDLRNNTFKIGRSKTPGRRERTLQSEVPEIVMRFSIPTEEAHERQLHDHFESKRLRGEWFNLTNDDLVWIVEFLKANGDSSRATVDYQWFGEIRFALAPNLREGST